MRANIRSNSSVRDLVGLRIWRNINN